MLELWVVFDSPRDFPGQFVSRKWILNQPTNEVLQDTTLSGLRSQLPKGLFRLDRSPHDDATVVETWV